MSTTGRRAIATTMLAMVGGGCGGPGTPPVTGPATGEVGNRSEVATGDGTSIAAAPVGTGDVVGTAHPLVVESAAPDGNWIAICQAREDTDGDGAIAVHVGMHGDTWGDRMRPYLVRGSGDGEPIDEVIAATPDGRWLAAIRDGKLAVLDARAGTWTVLTSADLRDDGVPTARHRAAAVSGELLTYFRDDEHLIIRELPTGTERVVEVKSARLWRAEPRLAGDVALLYAITKDTDGDGKLTWPTLQTSLSRRVCRGPIMSYSTGGWQGDTPEELWVDLATGAISTVSPPTKDVPREEIELGTVDGRPVLAIDARGRKLPAPKDSGRGEIASGPLRWEK